MKILDLGASFGFDCNGKIFNPAHVVELNGWDKPGALEEGLENCNLVCFGGGHDIHPSLYNHENVASFCGKEPSERDLFEVKAFKAAVNRNIPILGICRGAQLACIMSGGFLVQHIENHAGPDHTVNCLDVDYKMNSVHHQMMSGLQKTKAIILGYTDNLTNIFKYDTKKGEVASFSYNPEIVYFSDSKALAIQSHPEYYSDENEPSVVLTQYLIRRYLKVQV